MFSRLLQSKFFVYAASAGLILLIFYLGREFYLKYQIQKEITALKDEISFLESQNQQTEELLKFLKSPEYKERQARSLLSLQQPGEFAIALPPLAQVATATAQQAPRQSNLRAWWNYFFAPQ